MTTGRAACSIIVPCWNTPDVLDLCLSSLRLFTAPEVEVVVADRSTLGDDRCLRVAEKYGGHYLDLRQEVPNTHDMYAQVYNAALRAADGDEIVIAQDDIVFTPRWLETFREDAAVVRDRLGPVGLLGARSNLISGPQRLGAVPSGAIAPWWRIVLVAAYGSRRGLEEVGGFDEGFPTGMYADDDLSLRLIRAGYINAISRVYVHHFGGVATAQAGRDAAVDLAASEQYMKHKHGDWRQEARTIQHKWRVLT